MANDVNMVVLVGRLTRDPEMRYTNNGTALCRIALAVNRRKRSGDSWSDEVSFFDVSIWGKQAESLNNYLTKGKQIAVQGELRQNRWEQDGQKRSRVEVVANTIQLLGDPNGGGNAGGNRQSSYQNNPSRGSYANSAPQNQNQNQNQYKAQNDFSAGPEGFDDDIPF